MAKAGLTTRHSAKRLYNLRSIRAFRATEWLMLYTEYQVMKWVPEPPNPLTHTSPKTVIEFYATKGSDNKWQARKRCYERFKDRPEFRQKWMAEWGRQ